MYLIHSGAGLIKALTCPGGQRGSHSMCVLGVEGSEKNAPPEDNFWNSPYGQMHNHHATYHHVL